jgi:hypothetical protein
MFFTSPLATLGDIRIVKASPIRETSGDGNVPTVPVSCGNIGETDRQFTVSGITQTVRVNVQMRIGQAFFLDWRQVNYLKHEVAIVAHVLGINPCNGQAAIEPLQLNRSRHSPQNYFYLPDNQHPWSDGWHFRPDEVLQYVALDENDERILAKQLTPNMEFIRQIAIAIYLPFQHVSGTPSQSDFSHHSPATAVDPVSQLEEVGPAGRIFQQHAVDPHRGNPGFWSPQPHFIGIWNIVIVDKYPDPEVRQRSMYDFSKIGFF